MNDRVEGHDSKGAVSGILPHTNPPIQGSCREVKWVSLNSQLMNCCLFAFELAM